MAGGPVSDPTRDGPAPPRRWTLADIPYERIDRAKVAADERLFALVASASFIEITSETFTKNLVAFCAADAEVVAWLEDGWQREEVQHGAALRRYVETVWPDFDWDGAYCSFMDEYRQFCAVDLLAPTRALEMVARCVVETGTASFYRMLADAAPEPVLARLARFISRDEVDHYKHFYRYYRRYAGRERTSRAAVARTLLARTTMVGDEDAAIAFKHVRLARRPAAPYRDADYAEFCRSVRAMALGHYRFEAAVKMLLKPLELGSVVLRAVVPLASAAARRFLFA